MSYRGEKENLKGCSDQGRIPQKTPGITDKVLSRAMNMNYH